MPANRLRRAANRYRRTVATLEHDRDELHAAIVAALNAGIRPRDVVAVTGLTGEHVRRIAREHDVPPLREATVVRKNE